MPCGLPNWARSMIKQNLEGFRRRYGDCQQLSDRTYQTIYAVKLGTKLYVLHAFQKKSKRGIATPKKEIDLIRKQLQQARQLAQENEVMQLKKKGDIEYYEGSGNVYKDLGFENPEEWATKAHIATKIPSH